VARKAKGSPIAAGLIAFGAGMLMASLLPASRAEQGAAEKVKETAEPMVAELTDAAKEVAGNLQEPAQQAMAEVKSTASDAVDTVNDESASAAEDVKAQAADSKDAVQSAAN
jgi:ElaB/YqjD/DUF883 family membrane-anchored ribosome-binding protein